MKELKVVYNTNKVEKALEKVGSEKEVILSSTGSVAVEEIALGAGAPNVSLRSIVGITPVEAESGTYPIPRYDNTNILGKHKAGDKIVTHTFAELTSVPYDLSEDTGSGSIDDIVETDIDLHDDAKEIVEKGMDIEHDDRLINTENTEICNALLEDKTVIATTPETIGATMITSLCAKALKNARIITNMIGFAMLDIKISGIPLVKKDPNGNFIYNDKYIIDVLDNEILPQIIIGYNTVVNTEYALTEDNSINTEKEYYISTNDNFEFVESPILEDIATYYEKIETSEEVPIYGSPVIAGDIAHSVTILVNGKTKVADNDRLIFVFQRKYKDKELVIRLTDSDKAYIVASLA